MKWLRTLLHMLSDLALRAIRSVPKWSDLRSLGQSRVLRLSILVPFLGGLILFNQQLVQLVVLAPQVLGIDPLQENAQAIAGQLTLDRLYQYCFGLCALGIGSFLFALLCPAFLRSYDSLAECVETERSVTTDATSRLLFRQVIYDHVDVWDDDYSHVQRPLRSAWYPEDADALFHTVIHKAGEDVDLGEETGITQEDGFYFATGDLNVEKVVKVIADGRRAERYVGESFSAKALALVTELLALRYLVDNHAKPMARLAITVLYGTGFVALLLPTAATFWTILVAAVT